MMKNLTLLIVLLLCIIAARAQSKIINGKIMDSLRRAIAGASIQIKGTNKGTLSSINGDFSISAKAGDVLVVTVVSFGERDYTLGQEDSVTIMMNNTAEQLSDVVVTALGIRRRSDLLSSSQQGIKGADITSTRITDINTALAGKISNVQIRTQSTAKLGSQSSIRIRGANSVSDIDNDPLYVVDGTPLDDINFINLDDVEDVQVLKGPGATALYGQRAANGVILITLKKATPNSSRINFVSTYAFDKVGRLPHYQNEYSGGTAGAGMQTYTWQQGDPEEWKALDGKPYHTYYDDASWGPKMDGSPYIPWYAWFPGSKYSFKTAPLNPQPDNVKNFYSTGQNFINNISLSKGGSDYTARISYTNQSQTGLLPNSGLYRNYLSAQLSYNLNKHLIADIDVNYINQRINGEFADTYLNNASGSFNSWFHRDLDINKLKELKDLRTPTGAIPAWNLDDGSAGRPDARNFYAGTLYWTNPYTYYDLISAKNSQDRLFGSAGLTYKFSSHFALRGILRRNQRNTHYESELPYIFEKSTVDMQSALAINANASAKPVTATYRTYDIRQIESNYEFLSTYNQIFGNIQVDANVGGNIRQNDYSSLDNGTKGGLVIPDLYALSNSRITPFYFASSKTKKIVRSLYGSANANYNDIIVINATLRNDWSSALPVNNNSYIYPSIGGSFIYTKFIRSHLPFISFGKIRASWAEAGSDLDPYSLALLYNVGSTQFNGNITTTTPDKAIDSSITPQLSKSWEGGFDLRFLNNRIGISATYYYENITNSIVSVTIPSASGFSSKLINAGKLNRKGIELTVDAYPVKNHSFLWSLAVNFAVNKSKVISLYPGLTTYYLGGSDYSGSTGSANYAPGVWSIVGGEWGQLRGRGIKRNERGEKVINPATGIYSYTDNVSFGSVLPDFTGGLVNTLNYKGFNLNFAIDFTKGGKYFSLSDFWGGFSGLYKYTAGLNDKGKLVRNAVADGGGVHVTGVSSEDLKTPVDMYVDVVDYYDVNGLNKINETHIFDLSYVKLREVNLGYTFPLQKTQSSGTKISNLQLSLFARNPWLIYTKNRNFDPSELTGNYGESGQLPSSRTYGATLRIEF